MLLQNTKIYKSLHIFKSLVYIFQFGSLSFILIALNALGKSELAMSVGLIQSAILIATNGLSGNFRSLALAGSVGYEKLLALRSVISFIVLFVALIILFFLNMEHTSMLFFLITRKLIDWVDEICIVRNFKNKSSKNYIYFILQLSFLLFFPFIDFENEIQSVAYLALWIVSTLIIFSGNYSHQISRFFFNTNKLQKIFKITYGFFLATLITSLVNFYYRIKIFKDFDTKTASNIISSLSLPGIITSLGIFILMPDYINYLRRIEGAKFTNIVWGLFFFIGYLFLTLIVYSYKLEFAALNIDSHIFIVGSILGFASLVSNSMKQYQIQKFNITTFTEEIYIGYIILILILFPPGYRSREYFVLVPLISAIISILIYDINFTYIDKKVHIRKFLYLLFFLGFLIFSIYVSLSQIRPINFNFFKLKAYSLFGFLSLALLFHNLIQKKFKSNLLFWPESIFIFMWAIFISEYLGVNNFNYITLVLFIVSALIQYLFIRICTFINLRFIDNLLRVYIAILTAYFVF